MRQRNLFHDMMLNDLIGKEIEDIRVKVKYESYGLDNGDAFIVLKENLVIGVPWTIDNDDLVWERQLDKEALSIFEDKGNEKIKSIRGRRIVGLLKYEDSETGFVEAEKAFLELEGEKFITEITMAPNGTGLVGVWIFHSKEELEQRYGTNYKKLTQDKGST